MANEDLLKGVVLGVAATAVVAVAKRALGDRGDALGHAAIRLGGVIGEKAREIAAEIGEIAEDALAEIQLAEQKQTDIEPRGPEPVADEEAPKTGSR